MPAVVLTERLVRSLGPSTAAQTDHWDRKVRGLGLRVTQSGVKTWTLLYRHGRRLRRLTIGRYPVVSLADARDKANKALHAVSEGEDPAIKRQIARNAMTFEELAVEYVEKHAKKRKRSWREDHRLLNGSPHKKKTGKRPHVPLVRLWGPRLLTDIRRADVRDLIESTAERAPTMGNRLFALVRRIFNFAIERDWLEISPCQMIKAPAVERQRDRVLTEDEIARFWQATEAEHPTVQAILRLRLLTAQRGGEVLSMRWQDLDLGTGWWTIPAERSKNGLAHRVPLSPPATKILKSLKLVAEKRDPKSPWVFPSTRRNALHPIEHVQKAVERVRRRAALDFRGHDLRRTAASLMVGAGTPRLVVSKILNHVEQGVTAVYDRHSYDAEKRAALDAWGRRVIALLKAKRTSLPLQVDRSALEGAPNTTTQALEPQH